MKVIASLTNLRECDSRYPALSSRLKDYWARERVRRSAQGGLVQMKGKTLVGAPELETGLSRKISTREARSRVQVQVRDDASHWCSPKAGREERTSST